MKKIITAFCLAITFANVTGQSFRDALGNTNPVQQVQNTFLWQPASMLSLTAYDTVRYMSEINDPNFADTYPWISADGLRIYYTKSDNFKNEFYVTSRPDTLSPFAPPHLLDSIFPTITDVYSCWLSPDELDFWYLNDEYLYTSHRNTTTSAFSTPVFITLINSPVPVTHSPSLDSTQNELFIQHFTGIGRYLRTSPTSFTFSSMVAMPWGVTGGPGQLSKDGLSIFYAGLLGLSQIYQATRPDSATAFSIGQLVPGINDTTQYNGKPSVSANLDWMVFTRNNVNSWPSNELYIARKGGIATPVFETVKQNGLKISPNPIKDHLQFYLAGINVGSAEISIFDSLGKEVLKQHLQARNLNLDTSTFKKGLYFISVTINGESFSQKIIKL